MMYFNTDKAVVTLQPHKTKNQWFLSHPDLSTEPDKNWFNAEYWAEQGRLLGTYAGRGSVWMIKSDDGKWVLKHYYRGGLYAKISRDKYLWSGLQNTRAVREFKLLTHMHKQGLPCPKPVAVQVKKSGLFYTNDLITEFIRHQTTFAKSLNQNGNMVQLWAQVGQVIARFHACGIYHADLNVHNLLINNDDVYLIDFDKGEIKNNHKAWPQANLARLKRSIEKQSGQSCDRALKEHWQALLDSHQSTMQQHLND